MSKEGGSPLSSGNSEATSTFLLVTGIGRSVAWQYVGQAISGVGGLLLVGFVLRHVGASTYGVFALIVAVLVLFSNVDFGLNMFVVRAVARDSSAFPPDERVAARKEVEIAHSMYGAVGLAAVLISCASIPVLARIESHRHTSVHSIPLTVGLVGISVGLSLATSAYLGIPTGRQQFQVSSISGIIGTVANVLVVVLTLGSLGIVALGLGQLTSTMTGVVYEAIWLRRRERWFRLWPHRTSRHLMIRVGTFALPLFVISVAGQLIAATDLVVVGAVATATAVGLYKVGNLGPTQVSTWIFYGVDTAFPSLAGTRDAAGQEEATRFLSRITAYVDGSAFLTLILLRTDVVSAILGHQSALAEDVLIVFSAAAIANVSIHGLALLLIARGRQSVFVPLVIGEAVANLVLTVVFAILMGPIGAAVATLITIFVSNVVLFPIVVRKELDLVAPWRVMVDSLICIALGGGSASAAVAPVLLLSVGWLRLGCGFAAAIVLSGVIGWLLLRREGRQTLVAMLRRPAKPSDGAADAPIVTQ